VHRPGPHGWTVSSTEGVLAALGRGAALDVPTPDASSPGQTSRAASKRATLTLPLRRSLGAEHYRRSEESWEEAGRPTAQVSLERAGDRLRVVVDVPRAERRFVPIDADNPFDNDPAAIHGDGVQIYVEAGEHAAGWLLVPVAGTSRVDRRAADGWADALPLAASWRPSADGYTVTAEVTLPVHATEIGVDVLVNEIAAGRARRRGQLVLSGARGEFVYLRSDRHDRERLLRCALTMA
jgi:hypothetical protein